MAALAPTWKFVLSSIGNPPQAVGGNIGEVVDATNRQVIRALSAPSTAGFTIKATNPLLDDLYSQNTLLKCYRNGVLMFHGFVITVQFAGDDPTGTPTIAVTAADPAWRFDHTVSGASATGHVFGVTDRLTIAETLIADANARVLSLGNSYVQTLGRTAGGSGIAYTAGPYKKLSECLAELGNTLGGFDWRIQPTEATTSSMLTCKLGQFDAAAVIGSQKPNAVFEYEGRGNARGPTYLRSMDTFTNYVYSIPDQGPADPAGVLVGTNGTSLNTYGVLEEVVDTSGVINNPQRQAIVDDHILYRAFPRQVLTFQPEFSDGGVRVPEYGVDYQVGDLVRGRILYNNVALVDGFVRLYKMQFDMDENNRETLTPTVVNEAAG